MLIKELKQKHTGHSFFSKITSGIKNYSLLINLNQKHRSLEVFCKKCILKSLAKLTGKHLCRVSISIKLQASGQRCFPVNFGKIFKTPFSIEHHRWLFLLNKKLIHGNVNSTSTTAVLTRPLFCETFSNNLLTKDSEPMTEESWHKFVQILFKNCC